MSACLIVLPSGDIVANAALLDVWVCCIPLENGQTSNSIFMSSSTHQWVICRLQQHIPISGNNGGGIPMMLSCINLWAKTVSHLYERLIVC